MLDLADLEAHLSHELVCPGNLIGTVDAYHVNVHGQFKGMASDGSYTMTNTRNGFTGPIK